MQRLCRSSEVLQRKARSEDLQCKARPTGHAQMLKKSRSEEGKNGIYPIKTASIHT